MSFTISGAMSSVFFGSAAVVGSIISPASSRVFVEPEILRAFTAAGAPWLIGYTYDDIAMEKDFCASSLDSEPESLYVKAYIAACLEANEEMADLAAKLLELGLTVGESSTIASAIGTPHDRVLLLRREAREVAKMLSLSTASPHEIVVDAFRKGVIRLEELARLVEHFVKPNFTGGDTK